MSSIKKKLLHYITAFLIFCARRYMQRHKALVIGIHGSVGKTTCRMIVTQTLRHMLPHVVISTSPKNYNGDLGMPLAVLEIDNWEPTVVRALSVLCVARKKTIFWPCLYDVIVLEYGIDSPWEMTKLLSVVKPDIGIMTKLDAVHSEQFWDPNKLAKEEVKMIRQTRDIAYLNADELYTPELLSLISIDSFLYSTTTYDPDWLDIAINFSDETYHRDEKKKRVSVTFLATVHWEVTKVKTNIIGKENYGYIALSFSLVDVVSHRLWREKNDWKKSEKKQRDEKDERGKKERKNQKEEQKKTLTLDYVLQPWRMSVFGWVSDSVIVDSSYNAAPKSVQKIIENTYFLRQKLFSEYGMLMIFWDMRELWDLEEKLHRQIVTSLQMNEHLILVWSAVKKTLDELEKIWYDMSHVHYFVSSRKAGEYVKQFLAKEKKVWKNYIVIVKGSQNTIFTEETTNILLADKKDEKYLTRQSHSRKQQKDKFFASLQKEV